MGARAVASPLFTFAVMADSHMNPADDRCSSPWEVNKLANARTRAVVGELNAVAPQFVVHLGDMIHPVPSQAAYPEAAANFHQLFSGLGMPLHVVPGNHDVGDKPLAWTPAAVVTEEYVSLYEQHFGPSFYSFVHADCTFVVLNAQLLNTGFPAEEEQRQWLEEQLAEARRCFLFLHYPPYLLAPDEAGHYDNLDEPARTWLLEMIRRHHVEAVFAGHVHNFFYDNLDGTDFYVLPSVSFVRSDYAEFARIAPNDDAHGRNDVGKLGYFLVDVYAGGHRVIICRTHGELADQLAEAPPSRLLATRTRLPAGPGSVGIDLRHAWTEIIEVPYSGGVDEFARKRARNDYPVMALWEMGAGRLRIPVMDLTNDASRTRVQAIARQGHRFTPFVFGLPSEAERGCLALMREALEGIEVILASPVDAAGVDLAALGEEVGLPVFVSRLRGREDSGGADDHYHHVINHGYRLDERVLLEEAARGRQRPFAAGFVFRVGIDEEPGPALEALAAWSRRCDFEAVAQVRLAREVPASPSGDPLSAAVRVGETLLAAARHPQVRTFIDTFVEQDRGYFPRPGLIDRRYNLSPAGEVFRNFNAVVRNPRHFQDVALCDSCVSCLIEAEDSTRLLVLLPREEHKLVEVPALTGPRGVGQQALAAVDLTTGRTSQLAGRPAAGGLALLDPLLVDTPMIVMPSQGQAAAPATEEAR